MSNLCCLFFCSTWEKSLPTLNLKLVNRFDKKTRTGNVVGKRTIAGKIVKESYGAAKQQHTFTVRLC